MRASATALWVVTIAFPAIATAGQVNTSHPAQGPTYAPGGHAIIPMAPAPARSAVAPAPNRTNVAPANAGSYNSGPTYAPGGHAVVPQPPAFSPAFSSTNTNSTGAYVSPNHGANSPAPSYAPGGHAVIPNLQSPANVNARTTAGPQQNSANSLHAAANQPLPDYVGQIPPPSQGRLQFTPLNGAVGAPNAHPAAADSLSPGWQDRLPQYAYGPKNPAPLNPLGPNGTATVTQGFGVPWSQNANEIHTGVDIAAKPGALVSATQGGVVAKIGWLGCKDGTQNCSPNSPQSWGNYVVVRNPDGTAQGYLHVVPNPNLSVDSQIHTGQVIGTVYQDHLHYNNCLAASGCQHGAASPNNMENFEQPELQ